MSDKFKFAIVVFLVVAVVFAVRVHQGKPRKMRTNETYYKAVVLVMKTSDKSLVDLMVNSPVESNQLLEMVRLFEPNENAYFELENKRDAMSKLIRCMKQAIKILDQKKKDLTTI